MALFKSVDLGRDADDQKLIAKEINYILDRNRHTINFFGGYNVLLSDADNIVQQFYTVRQVYGKYHGIQLRHYLLSFSEEYDDITPYQAYRIGYEVAALFRDEYQVIFSVHEETKNLHIHFLVNSINIHTGKTLNNGPNILRNIQHQISYILAIPAAWSGTKPTKLVNLDYYRSKYS